MVYFIEHPIYKWMITGGTPMTWETSEVSPYEVSPTPTTHRAPLREDAAALLRAGAAISSLRRPSVVHDDGPGATVLFRNRRPEKKGVILPGKIGRNDLLIWPSDHRGWKSARSMYKTTNTQPASRHEQTYRFTHQETEVPVLFNHYRNIMKHPIPSGYVKIAIENSP